MKIAAQKDTPDAVSGKQDANRTVISAQRSFKLVR